MKPEPGEKCVLMNKIIFTLIHLGCFCALWSGVSAVAVAACLGFYLVRMFAITAGYHRYFSHRSYKTSRWFQFLLAVTGASAAQRGPLWWAANHRHHHMFSDTEHDLHSPGLKGIWWAHAGWVLSPTADESDPEAVKDLAVFPELLLVERYHFLPPLIFLFSTYFLGVFLNRSFPALGTSGMQMATWGALMSTVLLYHATFCINSLAHLIGRRRFDTADESKNSFILSVITLGEGWHNNHHRYPGSERQGFFWWELDISHYVLKLLSLVGIVWDLRSPPARIYQEAERARKDGVASNHVRRAF